jgi:hypothetical protein
LRLVSSVHGHPHMDASHDDLVRDIEILRELVDGALERKDETLFYACSQLLTDRRVELAGLERAVRDEQ